MVRLPKRDYPLSELRKAVYAKLELITCRALAGVDDAAKVKTEFLAKSANVSAVALNKEPIVEYMGSNITLMKSMIAEGYADARTLKRSINAMGALTGRIVTVPESPEAFAIVMTFCSDTARESPGKLPVAA